LLLPMKLITLHLAVWAEDRDDPRRTLLVLLTPLISESVKIMSNTRWFGYPFQRGFVAAKTTTINNNYLYFKTQKSSGHKS
jgi:hypothetical protein